MERATATVYGNEIWIADNAIIAYNYSSNTHRKTELVTTGCAFMISHRNSLYIFTSESKSIQVITDNSAKSEIVNQDTPGFGWIGSTI